VVAPSPRPPWRQRRAGSDALEPQEPQGAGEAMQQRGGAGAGAGAGAADGGARARAAAAPAASAAAPPPPPPRRARVAVYRGAGAGWRSVQSTAASLARLLPREHYDVTTLAPAELLRGGWQVGLFWGWRRAARGASRPAVPDGTLESSPTLLGGGDAEMRLACMPGRASRQRQPPLSRTVPRQGGTALLVMPGGADLPYCKHLNGAGNALIRGEASAARARGKQRAAASPALLAVRSARLLAPGPTQRSPPPLAP
jgi:hypothetical protein